MFIQNIKSHFFILYFCLINFCMIKCRLDIKKSALRNDSTEDFLQPLSSSSCSLNLHRLDFFGAILKLEAKYAENRKEYQNAIGGKTFDNEMIKVILKKRGAAVRTIHEHTLINDDLIPAGINLGGHSIMRIKDELLFFYRMKLRNDTSFRLDCIKNDFDDMALRVQIKLNDLYLFGTYSSCSLKTNPMNYIFFSLMTKEVQFLLKNVTYKLQGRYRLLQDRFKLEMIVSTIDIGEVLMMRMNNDSKLDTENIDKNKLDEFVARLKTDLNKWMLDYFDDYLMYYNWANKPIQNQDIQTFDNEKTQILNKYVDDTISVLSKRLRDIGSANLDLPDFTIIGPTGVEFYLKNGTISGLDSLYRRSVATGTSIYRNVINVNAVVAFSDLKVEYKYLMDLRNGYPPVAGYVVFTADELTALMALKVTMLVTGKTSPYPTEGENSMKMKVQYEYLENTKSESLTIEGPASRMIPNFRHVLETHFVSIMTHVVVYYTKMLGTVADCVTYIPPVPKDFGYGNSTSAPNSLSSLISDDDIRPEDKLNDRDSDLNDNNSSDDSNNSGSTSAPNSLSSLISDDDIRPEDKLNDGDSNLNDNNSSDDSNNSGDQSKLYQ